jgi:hypothetical protein
MTEPLELELEAVEEKVVLVVEPLEVVVGLEVAVVAVVVESPELEPLEEPLELDEPVEVEPVDVELDDPSRVLEPLEVELLEELDEPGAVEVEPPAPVVRPGHWQISKPVPFSLQAWAPDTPPGQAQLTCWPGSHTRWISGPPASGSATPPPHPTSTTRSPIVGRMFAPLEGARMDGS